MCKIVSMDEAPLFLDVCACRPRVPGQRVGRVLGPAGAVHLVLHLLQRGHRHLQGKELEVACTCRTHVLPASPRGVLHINAAVQTGVVLRLILRCAQLTNLKTAGVPAERHNDTRICFTVGATGPCASLGDLCAGGKTLGRCLVSFFSQSGSCCPVSSVPIY